MHCLKHSRSGLKKICMGFLTAATQVVQFNANLFVVLTRSWAALPAWKQISPQLLTSQREHISPSSRHLHRLDGELRGRRHHFKHINGSCFFRISRYILCGHIRSLVRTCPPLHPLPSPHTPLLLMWPVFFFSQLAGLSFSRSFFPFSRGRD